MRIPLEGLSRPRKLENAIIVSVLLFLFKIVFGVTNTIALAVINELLVGAAVFLWCIYIIDFMHAKLNTPMQLVLNAGILNALIFIVVIVVTNLFDSSPDPYENPTFLYSSFTILFALLFIGAVSYMFSAFRELFYIRQKRDPSKYFNVMLVFLVLTGYSYTVESINPELDYFKEAFSVIALLLIIINSMRVAWIAFLVKKQKIYLLIISIVLSILFGLNYGLTHDINIINDMLIGFSPALQGFYSTVMIYGSIYFGIIFFTTLFHLPTAEAFDRKAEEVSSLMDLSKLITQVFDFKELADTVTGLTTKVCNSDSAWLVTKTDDGFELSSVNNIGYVEADKITNNLLLKQSYNIDTVQTINHSPIKVRIKNDIRTFNFRSIAIAPLKVHTEINGFLFAAKKTDFVFDEDDKKAIGAFGDYAAVAIENAKLIEESLEKERLEKELDVAREIQYKILPDETPDCDTLKISALFVPAFEVGGDYYDFFKIGEHKLGFVVADVSGKGISAAFIMAEVKGVFETLAKLIESPKELLIKANSILKGSLEKKSFVTAIYGVVDTQTGVMKFARAGHAPLFYCTNAEVKRLTPKGIGLGLDYGINFDMAIEEMEIKLNNNDIVTLFTDGINESQNAELEEFGYDRFEKIVIDNCGEDVNRISNEIMKSVTVFSKDSSQHDDITLVILKWNLNKQTVGEN